MRDSFLIRCRRYDAEESSPPPSDELGLRTASPYKTTMKITCASCGSKYTIADEKVQGRKVKVRCKSCKANILVDGTVEGAGEVTATQVGTEGEPSENPKPNAWSVNLADDDSREMTTEELVAGWKDGVVTQDAYVWKDGMADWRPILDVAELKVKLLAANPGAVKAAMNAGVSTPGARALPGQPADDLFGGLGDGPKGLGGGEERKPTGARNESSVLFSLDALKAQVPEKAPKPTGTSPADLFSMGSMPGGGLLTSNVDLLTAPALEPPPAPVGARIATSLAPQRSGNTMMFLAIAFGAIALGLGAYFAFAGGSDAAATEEASKEAEALKTQIAETQRKAEEELKKAEAERKKLAEDLERARAEAEKDKKDPASAAKDTPKEAAKEEPNKEPSSATASNTTATPAPSAGSAAATPAPAASAPPFDVGAAKTALSSAASSAASCAKPGGPSGSGKVQVTFAPSGRVTSANVTDGTFGGTPVGGCVASTFRKARVPAFSGSPQTVSKSFTIK